MLPNYVLQETKGIKKSFDNGVSQDILKFMDLPIFSVKTSDEWTEIHTSTEGFSGTRVTGRRETPDVNALGDGFSVSHTPERYTNAFSIDSTDMEKFKDSTTKVKEYLTRQRNAMLLDIKYTMMTSMYAMLNDAVAGATFVCPDTVALLGTHTWNTTGAEGFTNKTTSKLNLAAIDAMVLAGSYLTGGDGKQMPQSYDTIIVAKGSDNAIEAKKLFAQNIVATQYLDTNIYEGGMYKIIETPMISYANRDFWFAMDTSKGESPLAMSINKAPTLAEPILEKNLSVFQAIEGFWKRGIINQPFSIYGGDGTA